MGNGLSVTTYECAGCGVTVTRPPTKGQRPKWCSEECRYAATFTPKRRACDICGEWIKASGLAHKACQRRRAKRLRAEAKAVKARAGTVGATFVQGNCGWCTNPFTRRGAVSRYCSKLCSRRAARKRNRRKYGKQWISDADRFAIYERDKWMCQLCLKPVDRMLHYLNDMAASLDHIEPRSWTLIPDDTPRNLRLAHRICNSARRDLPDAA